MVQPIGGITDSITNSIYIYWDDVSLPIVDYIKPNYFLSAMVRIANPFFRNKVGSVKAFLGSIGFP